MRSGPTVRWWWAGWAGVLVATLGAPALAQSRSTNQVTAEGLFEEGRKLMTQGKFAEACPKLAESQRLDPGGGTMLNVAVCHEKEGKTASAWAEFNEALAWALKDGRDNRARLAREHIAKLAPTLRRVAVRPVGERAAELEIKVDGVVVGDAAWGVATPLDPGEHVVSASAPRHLPWRSTFVVPADGAGEDHLTIEVPALLPRPEEPEKVDVRPPAAAPPGDLPPPTAIAPGRRTAAYVALGFGGAGLVVGSVFAVMTLAKRSDSNGFCPNGDTSCDPEGVRLNKLAIDYSWVSTVGFGAGLVGGALGTYLLLSGGPAKRPSAASIEPLLGPRAFGASLHKSF